MTGWTLVGIFLAACTPHCLPTATSNLSHGNQAPTIEGEGWRSTLIERRHRSHESCREDLEYHTSQGRLWHRWCPSHNDQGSFHLRDQISGLTRSQESMINQLDYVELALFCADICRALERGMDGMKLDDLSQSVCDAINQLMT